MFIYKISNSVNNKVYIGQTIRPIEERFARHINDAMNGILDTHFARAIRLYGPDKFSIELIDTATTQEEVTQKEHDYIIKFNSVEEGYNETDAISKCGGNTYKSKTKEEMEVIKEKIRSSKLGGKNPHSRKIKCKILKPKRNISLIAWLNVLNSLVKIIISLFLVDAEGKLRISMKANGCLLTKTKNTEPLVQYQMHHVQNVLKYQILLPKKNKFLILQMQLIDSMALVLVILVKNLEQQD